MSAPTEDEAPAALAGLADTFFEQDALPVLERYTRIECLSPEFDPDWATTGHICEAADLLAEWAVPRRIEGLEVKVVQLEGLTPVIVADIPATAGWGGSDRPTLLYGHLDKQPPLGQWRPGLGPYTPVREGDHLYGRGTADDGYAAFAALGAIEASEAAGLSHGRCIVLIEASEESGSPHLPPYLEMLQERLGPSGPGLVICLDSGCLSYDRLWTTTSLRGFVMATITVRVLREGVHSGAAGGVVPSSMRLLRQLLSRIEDEQTGEVLVEACRAEVPEHRRREAADLVASIGDGAMERFPVVEGLRLGGTDPVDRVLAQTWRPAIAFVGIDGVPPVREAGNVLRPFTTAKLAMRLPPSADADLAAEAVRSTLATQPPEGAVVEVVVEGEGGFDAPQTAPWLAQATRAASTSYFGRPPGAMGEGGSIPFLHRLAVAYPEAQFLVTGVLGPASNAHGPNEMLHLPTAKRVTASVAHVLSRVP